VKLAKLDSKMVVQFRGNCSCGTNGISDVTPPLKAAYEEGLKANPPNVWIHKNRGSGLLGDKTLCIGFLEKEGIKMLFAGVNTDQCVGGSLQDAFTKGRDCVLLSDGAGTTSPDQSGKH
jgi:nicotinamidase-related amidase